MSKLCSPPTYIFLPTHTFIYIVVWSRIIPEIKAVIFLFQWRITKKEIFKGPIYFFSQWTTKIIRVILILLHKTTIVQYGIIMRRLILTRNIHFAPYNKLSLMYFSIMNKIYLWANITSWNCIVGLDLDTIHDYTQCFL